jgi:AcrR family transcriptional regulator
VPKLWSDTIVEHRSAVRDAILDATGRLVHRDGLTGLTMTALAEASGVGRATLYKYVPDVAAALTAWQEREIGRHLQRLRTIAQESPPESRLSDVLLAYARLRRHRHGDDDALHGTIRLAPAESELTALVQEIIDDDTRAGTTRTDLSPQELAAYAVGAIGAAAALPDTTAVSRLATLVVATIRQDAEE